MFNIQKLQKCEGCEGSSMQIDDVTGILRPCPLCATSWGKFSNQYGTDGAEAPEVYYDEESKLLTLVNKKKDEIILPNGFIIPNK